VVFSLKKNNVLFSKEKNYVYYAINKWMHYIYENDENSYKYLD